VLKCFTSIDGTLHVPYGLSTEQQNVVCLRYQIVNVLYTTEMMMMMMMIIINIIIIPQYVDTTTISLLLLSLKKQCLTTEKYKLFKKGTTYFRL